jgi:protein-disulfide isomerase
MIIGTVVVVVLAVAMAIGLVVEKNHRATAADHVIAPVVSAAAVAPVVLDRSSGVVTVGRPSAVTTLDIYEDPLCPLCGRFEHEYGEQIERALADGTVQVRYHLLNLLDDRSSPPHYSVRASTAALAVAGVYPGAFMSFHHSLFADQPAEGSPGYNAGQLDKLATALQIPKGEISKAVDNHLFDATVQADLAAAEQDPALQSTGGGFGTPTVLKDGQRVDLTSSDWLINLTRTN